jgi:hypothetical protein
MGLLMAKAFAFQFCKHWQMVRQIALLQTQMEEDYSWDWVWKIKYITARKDRFNADPAALRFSTENKNKHGTVFFGKWTDHLVLEFHGLKLGTQQTGIQDIENNKTLLDTYFYTYSSFMSMQIL